MLYNTVLVLCVLNTQTSLTYTFVYAKFTIALRKNELNRIVIDIHAINKTVL